jgi:hypothetical protein
MLATSTDQYQNPNSLSFDTDGVYFITNNSANGGICNIKSMFPGDFEQQIVALVTAEGRATAMKQVGTIRLFPKDDAGKTWSYDIPDVVYEPELPYGLLGIPFLGKCFARNDKANEYQKQIVRRRAVVDTQFFIDILRYDPHQQPPFSNGTVANINDTLNMEALICQNY